MRNNVLSIDNDGVPNVEEAVGLGSNKPNPHRGEGGSPGRTMRTEPMRLGFRPGVSTPAIDSGKADGKFERKLFDVLDRVLGLVFTFALPTAPSGVATIRDAGVAMARALGYGTLFSTSNVTCWPLGLTK